MSVSRWDPVHEIMSLREAMDRLLQQSMLGPSQLLSGVRQEAITMDMADRGNVYVIRASIPGVNPDDVEVMVDGSTLTIRGERRAEEDTPGENWLLREHRYGRWQRSVTLPEAVNTGGAQARYEQGMLILTLPKLESAAPKRIQISRGSTAPSSASTSAGGAAGGAQPSPGAEKSAHAANDQRVSQSSEESFPASDPPSWTPEKA